MDAASLTSIASSIPQLDITPLANAVARLREGLERHLQEPDDDQLRDGLIQRFEFTYELSDRILKRFLRLTAASPEEVDRMSFQDLIRTANQQNLLLGDWPAWHRYRDLRARTSQTYHAETAEQVAAAIPAFLAEAGHLANALISRLP
jgi:nucleotidyltransferase substrate binding protein (TIGR01987 family)